MLQRNLTDNRPTDSLIWEDLSNGVPAIAAFAQLCGCALADPGIETGRQVDLPPESLAILHVAQTTGCISIRGDRNAFEPAERLLAVCVEQQEGRRIEFRIQDNPELTIRFLGGFRQLCQSGLVMHQLMNDFSLTVDGFERARQVDHDSVEPLIAMGRESV